MNNGMICVSVCAKTADELVEQTNRINELAGIDALETRFDCLKHDEIQKAWQTPSSIKSELTTFRPKEQGGCREISWKERLDFWNKAYAVHWADFELDLAESKEIANTWLTIHSYHDFNGVPKNLNEIYERVKLLKSFQTVIKIAVQTEDITDTIPVWNLLKRAKLENQEIIPIAMGESGKWTRILGLAHGAFMTYASLDSSSETAPGQVSAQDLIEVYRAKELNENTEVYGILGSNTSVSMSPYIHNEAFKFHKLNSVFVPLQVQNIDEFMRRMVKSETREVDLNFKGFSVTIPHKQSIIKQLDYLDASAQAIGAVNTVKIQDGKLYGYNTDAHGFIQPLLQTYGDLNEVKVAVLGAGGAARACIYALKEQGAKVTIFARDLDKTKSLMEEFDVELKPLGTQHSALSTYGDFDILVNTTPLGMKGKADGETPATAEQLKGLKLVYDLIYIPFQTPLMDEADKAEVPKIGGLAMLIAQAVEQQRIWTELDAPMKEMSRAALKRLT